MSKVSIY